METELKKWTVRTLISGREENELRVNMEYQRAAIWKDSQMRLLVDSVFRGYQIPLIYLRRVEKSSTIARNEYYDIIDGQQRINALRSFLNGVVIEEGRGGDSAPRTFPALYDPMKDADKKHFPISIQGRECAWGGKLRGDIDEATINEKFLDVEVPVALMHCTDDEARDLFIRLQGGSDLTAQEVRDAWPGNFCDLVLQLGGKPQMARPGHDFFLKAMKAKPRADRGKIRQLTAQLLMLFLEQKAPGHDRDHFVTIKSDTLDDYYREQAGLDLQSPEVKRFKDILDKLFVLFSDGRRKPLKGHDAIHMILFVDMLWDTHTPMWERGLAGAFDAFRQRIAEAKEFMDGEFPAEARKELREAWYYDSGTRARSDVAATIRRRHEIYEEQMFQLLGGNAIPKDPRRAFTPLQRAKIYDRDRKLCHVCKSDVAWDDADIHHLKPHSKGGLTIVENGVLIHRECHRDLHAQQNKGGE